MSKPNRTFETYPDKGGRYRWRARAKNGQITAVSGESFASHGNAKRALQNEVRAFTAALVVGYGCERGR